MERELWILGIAVAGPVIGSALGVSFPPGRRTTGDMLSFAGGAMLAISFLELLPESLLGRYLDAEALQVMERAGIDLCGENGEYHTLAVDGPVFQAPLEFRTGGILRYGEHSVVHTFS